MPAFGNGARQSLRLRSIHAVLQQVGNSENAGERRADLVPDKGQELRLFLLKGPCFALFLLKALVCNLKRPRPGRVFLGDGRQK